MPPEFHTTYNSFVPTNNPDALRIAVLISGSGSTLLNILERVSSGQIKGQVCGVVASRVCSGLDHARKYEVPSAVVKRGKPFDVDDFSARVTAQLDEWQPGLIVFGGFLSRYLIPSHYENKAINIHPALLPGFGGKGMYGDRVHEAVLASGAKVTGCSVHFVDNEYDQGAIIAQKAVSVVDGDTADTLGPRVRQAEREIYPMVISWFADGRISVGNDGHVQVTGRDHVLNA